MNTLSNSALVLAVQLHAYILILVKKWYSRYVKKTALMKYYILKLLQHWSTKSYFFSIKILKLV